MAKDFRRADRDQSFLLPPDLRDWLPEGHLAWFVIELVEQFDMRPFEVRARLGRAGRAPFDPRTLLAVLIYGYATGQRSSRQLERLCETDVAFRVLAGNEVPDHTTLARFRQRHEQAFIELFAQVLVLCARAGLGKFGTVSIDGTKIAASASLQATRSESTLRAQLAEQTRQIVAGAEQLDAAEDAQFGDARGDELPASWSGRDGRQARLRAALADLEAEQRAAQAAQQQAAQQQSANAASKAERRLAQAQARLERELQAAREREHARAAKVAQAAAQGRRLAGAPGVAADEHVYVQRARAQLARAQDAVSKAQEPSSTPADRAPNPAPASTQGKGTKQGKTPDTKPDAKPDANKDKEGRRNSTDPDSRVMLSKKGWLQGYNAQLAVTDDQIVVAVRVVNNPVDAPQFEPMMRAAEQAAELISSNRPHPQPQPLPISMLLADAGYASEANLTLPGPPRLIALGRRRDQNRRAADLPTHGDPPPQAGPREQMDHRLRTADGTQTYKRRSVTVEPVNGHLKDRVGLRQFSRRGLTAVTSELHFATTVLNVLKLHRATTALA